MNARKARARRSQDTARPGPNPPPLRTYWNGEPADCRRVRVLVAPSSGWAAEFVGTTRNAVEVRYFDEPFYIDDEDGSGWFKVTTGWGGPGWGHRSLSVSEVLR